MTTHINQWSIEAVVKNCKLTPLHSTTQAIKTQKNGDELHFNYMNISWLKT